MKPHRNHGLFSNYYLDELLPREEEFGVSRPELKGTFQAIKSLWDKDRLSSLNEPQLRKHFLDKVFDFLGWTVDVEPPTPSGEWSRHPDYAFFRDRESLSIAQKATGDVYFKKALCLGEAKRWGRSLDKKLKAEADPFEVQNPSLQMSRYLWLTGVKWGILTEGRYWRLYERETSKRLDVFYEIDLEDLIENGSEDDFKYFYLFFRRDAFPDFLEKVYQESLDYAQAVGEELKENVYQALKTLAEGFLKAPGNNLSGIHLKEIHDNSLILLYRLLFILYAEHRGLLPLGENRFYSQSYSLDALKKEIAQKLDRNESIATSTFGYWNRLKELFEIINRGNPELEVPPYNGGLFDPDKHRFLEDYRVGDLHIARAIDLLSRSSDKAHIDYGSLEIRHLGSIYEGLLEYKLAIADEDIVPIKEKGREIFIYLEEARTQKKRIREDEVVRKGEVYLATDRGERKATGSYYTPHYIVKYIVENTLGPLIEEKRKKVGEKIREAREKIKNTRGQDREFYEKELKEAESSPIDEILSIKVLDPAMGSGHFLVEATDFLARELLKALGGEPLEEASGETVIREVPDPYDPKQPEEEDIRWARREVVEKCIFGVDLNPLAVELAKLSIWLHTVARNRPLNFLDHHLRCGNSLIGARIEDLVGLPDLKKKKRKEEGELVQLGLFESIFKEKVNILLSAFAQIEDLPSETVEQVRKKEKYYNEFRKIVSRFQDVEDVWSSVYFGNEVSWSDYQRLQDSLRSTDKEWAELSQEFWFKKAKQIAEEKHFFHWELEFPEVFFEGHQRKENPGFDVVIGNPPYVGFHGFEEMKNFLRNDFESCKGKFDIYIPFWEQVIRLLRRSGLGSFITPSGFMKREHGVQLQEIFLQHKLLQLHDFQHRLVFEGVTNYTCILVVAKDTPYRGHRIRITAGPSLSDRPHYLRQSDLGAGNWIIGEGIEPIVSRVLHEPYVAFLKEFSSCIAEGIVTGKNDAFLVSVSSGPGRFLHSEGIAVPALRGESVDRYETKWDGTLLIYPYEFRNSRTVCMNEDIVKQRFPVTYRYLSEFQNLLKGRSYFERSTKKWFELWNQRDICHQKGRKLVVQENSIRNEFVLDDGTFAYLDTCCGVSFFDKSEMKDTCFLAMLNSLLLDKIFETLTVPKAGGHYIHKPMFLEKLPIRRISFVTPKEEREKLVENFKEMYERWLGKG